MTSEVIVSPARTPRTVPSPDRPRTPTSSVPGSNETGEWHACLPHSPGPHDRGALRVRGERRPPPWPEPVQGLLRRHRRMTWPGPFKLDFTCPLVFTGLWIAWRHRFPSTGILAGPARMRRRHGRARALSPGGERPVRGRHEGGPAREGEGRALVGPAGRKPSCRVRSAGVGRRFRMGPRAGAAFDRLWRRMRCRCGAVRRIGRLDDPAVEHLH
jgi:hypothetical protein